MTMIKLKKQIKKQTHGNKKMSNKLDIHNKY
jgi:hypothetical protein